MRWIMLAVAVTALLVSAAVAVDADGGYKGKIREDFVFLQTDIDQRYDNQEDVTFKVKGTAYRNGISLDTNIKIYIYGRDGQRLLDTKTSNPVIIRSGDVTTINLGKCSVGLYRATIRAESGSLDGVISAQWVVAYPPHDYYFAWKGPTSGGLISGATDTVEVEFRSQETYETRVFNESANETRVVERKYGFDVTVYTYDASGKRILEQFTNVTSIDETFRNVHQSGIFADVEDIHGWRNNENRDPFTGVAEPYHWLGGQKWSASPKWNLPKVILLAIILVASILIVSYRRINEAAIRRDERKKIEKYRGDND